MKYLTNICEMVIVLSLLLVSCTDSIQPTQHSTAIPAFEFIPPTTTPFSKTPTFTDIPTSTLYPILDADSAAKLVFQLLVDNSSCQLPCWWNVTPGKTTSRDAESFLHSFSSVASTNSLNTDGSSMRLRIPNGNGLLYLTIEYSSVGRTVDRLVVGVSQLTKNKNGDYEQIFGDPAFAEVAQSLMPSEILNLYGQPKEILVSTYSLQPLGWSVFFDIQLFYPDYGFLIVYQSLMEFSTNGRIKGCPSRSNIYIGLWEPGKYQSTKDLPNNIRNNLSGFPLSSYLQVDKATEMSIQDFYDTFKADGTLCLETPSRLWPIPGQ